MMLRSPTSYLFLVFSLCCGSCSSQLVSDHEERHQTSLALDEMRIELSDVKHALKSYEVELRILEEKLTHQASAAQQPQVKQTAKLADAAQQIVALERRLSLLEKNHEKALLDLKQLSAHANQTSASLVQYKEKIQECEQLLALQNERISEVVKLKSTLSSISKAIQRPSSPERPLKNYKVKPGDSLEKIARQQRCSVEEIKRANHLENDRIAAGQELKIPHEEE